MIKIVDRLLLFLYSLAIGVCALVGLALGAGGISERASVAWVRSIYEGAVWLQATVIVVSIVIFLISLRFFYLSVRRSNVSAPSIDQRTAFGDIRISMETVENLSLKAASKQRGVKDLKARIRVVDAGLEIGLRAVVDGESSIPQLTEDVQRVVKEHVEDVTGIPVAAVTVFVANIVQSQTFKSRVE